MARKAETKEVQQAKIAFSAQVYKVQTLVDNGLRVSLDLPETETKQAAMLMECQLQGMPLRIIATVDAV